MSFDPFVIIYLLLLCFRPIDYKESFSSIQRVILTHFYPFKVVIPSYIWLYLLILSPLLGLNYSHLVFSTPI